MLGCRSVQPTWPSRTKLAELLRVFAEAAPQDLDRHHLAGLAVYGAEHAGERACAHHVEHFVRAVEEAGAIPFDHPLDLVVGHELAADQQLQEVVQLHATAAQGGPNFAHLPLVEQFQILRPLGELFRGRMAHAAADPITLRMMSKKTGGPAGSPYPFMVKPNRSCDFGISLDLKRNYIVSSNLRRNSSRSRRVDSRSKARYFMSNRSWPNASWTRERIRRRRLEFTQQFWIYGTV